MYDLLITIHTHTGDWHVFVMDHGLSFKDCLHGLWYYVDTFKVSAECVMAGVEK